MFCLPSVTLKIVNWIKSSQFDRTKETVWYAGRTTLDGSKDPDAPFWHAQRTARDLATRHNGYLLADIKRAAGVYDRLSPYQFGVIGQCAAYHTEAAARIVIGRIVRKNSTLSKVEAQTLFCNEKIGQKMLYEVSNHHGKYKILEPDLKELDDFMIILNERVDK
jgi:hypothetical protein